MAESSVNETQQDPPPAPIADPAPIPIPVVPTCEQMAAAACQTLSGLPADRSGAVAWDHVQKVLYVPT